MHKIHVARVSTTARRTTVAARRPTTRQNAPTDNAGTSDAVNADATASAADVVDGALLLLLAINQRGRHALTDFRRVKRLRIHDHVAYIPCIRLFYMLTCSSFVISFGCV